MQLLTLLLLSVATRPGWTLHNVVLGRHRPRSHEFAASHAGNAGHDDAVPWRRRTAERAEQEVRAVLHLLQITYVAATGDLTCLFHLLLQLLGQTGSARPGGA